MRGILVFIALLVCTCQVKADVKIEDKNKVYNKAPGFCMWSCLETLARHQKIEKLYGLVEARSKDPDFLESKTVLVPGYMTPFYIVPEHYEEQVRVIPNNYGTILAVREKLDKLGVKYKTTSNRDLGHLKQSIVKNGCVICLRANPIMKEDHAVILTRLTDTEFEYIDPNDGRYWIGSRVWFNYYWSGEAVSLEN